MLKKKTSDRCPDVILLLLCQQVLSRLFYLPSRGLSKDITDFVFEWETTKNSVQPIQFLGFGKDITPFAINFYRQDVFTPFFLTLGRLMNLRNDINRNYDDLVCFGLNNYKVIQFS
jgi:hypothetical protein